MTFQYLTDKKGKKISVVLPIKEYETILEKLEELEDIKSFDEAVKEDTGERVLFSEYLKKRKAKNA